MNKPKTIKTLLVYAFLIITFLIFVLPFVYMVIAATQNNGEITSIPPVFRFSTHAKENISILSEKYDYFHAYLNTAIVTVVGTVLSTFIVSMSGYAFAKFNFKGQKFLFNVLLFTSMIPIFSTMLPLFIMFSRVGLLNTYASLIIPLLASASSIFMMRQYMYAVPDDVLESARIDGANEFLIFLKIVMPMSVPAIVTGALTIFIGYWNSYLWPLISITSDDMQILPLVIRNMGLTRDEIFYGARYMGLALSVIPIIVLYILVQRKFESTGVSESIK